MSTPIAKLVIADPRSDGYVIKSAWGLDWPMTTADRTRQLAGPYANAAFESPVWYRDGVIPLPELGAVMLDYSWGNSDMVLGSWIQNSSYWREVQPPGWGGMTWLKGYDGGADEYQALLSSFTIPKNASWGLRFLRSQPPADQIEVPYIALNMNALGTERFCIYLPQDGSGYPRLLYSSDSGANWSILDEFAQDEAVRWAAGAFEQPAWLSCLWVPDHLIIHLGDTGLRWIYYEPGLQIPQGHVLFESEGGQIAFHFDQLAFISPGAIELYNYISAPDFLNDEAADTVEILCQEPDGTEIAAEMVDDENGLYPSATLYSDGDRTPLLYEIQATRPAKHATPVTAVRFDNTDGDTGVFESCEFYCAKDQHGSWFKATLRTAGEYAFGGNEKAQLSVAFNAETPTYVEQVTGYLETPKLVRDAKQPGVIMLHLAAHDRFVRLKNKSAYLLPSFAGWSFQDAFTWLFHECAGIPEAHLTLDAGASEYIYDCPLQHLILQFDQTLKVDAVADALAKAAGRRWGVDRLGQIFTVALGTEVYDGTPEFILDDDTVTEDDFLYFVEIKRDIFALRNRVLCLGKDANGNDQIVSWRWTESMSDPNADAFIGDEWCEVIFAPDGGKPGLTAQFRGTELMQYQRLLKWQTNGKPALFPGHFVAVNVSDIDVAPGTVFKILEKHGTLNPEKGEFITEFMGAAL